LADRCREHVVNHLEVAELDQVELDAAADELADVGGEVR
jgi:hypothetical protein